MRPTLTAMYHDVETAQRAIEHLTDEGFSRNDISLLVNLVHRDHDPYKLSKSRYTRRGGMDAPMGILLGLLSGIAIGAVAGIVLSFLPYAFPLGAMAGWGALIGGLSGAVTGGLLNSSMPRILSQNLTTVAKTGASMVRVAVLEDEVQKARRILAEHDPVDMSDRQDAWGEKGWEPYDPAAEPVR